MYKTSFQLKIRDLITNPKYDSLEPDWKRNKRDDKWYVIDWEGLVNEIVEKGLNLNELSIEMGHNRPFIRNASRKGARLRGDDLDILEDLTKIDMKQYATVFVPKRIRDK
jgi:hypothetical protein